MEPKENSVFHKNAVFFIEVDKIKPNPFQPRKEFDQARLNELSDSIRMYGILQPLVVTRRELVKEDGGLSTEYELIAGERRLRAAKLAGLREVPALIRCADDDERTKLELAIIENLQREDLNSIDRAMAFKQLSEKFGFSHAEIGKKMGRSREYVSNTLRLLMLTEEMQSALINKQISEGHTRPLLMLIDRPEEQNVLFKEIMLRKMTVRDAEKVARRIAYDKVRRKEKMYNPEIVEIEEEVSGVLGTRVHIERREKGGRIEIDFFDEESLKNILDVIRTNKKREDPFANFPMSRIVEKGYNTEDEESAGVVEVAGDAEVAKDSGFIEVAEQNDVRHVEQDVEQDIEQSAPAGSNQNQNNGFNEITISNNNSGEVVIENKDQTDFPEEESVSHEVDESEDDSLYSIDNFCL